MIIFNLRFSEDYYDKEAMVNFLICTRKIGDTFKNLTQLGQSKHGVDAVCNYKQADMSAMFVNINIQNGKKSIILKECAILCLLLVPFTSTCTL